MDRDDAGFTLIELMVVLLIIGVLLSIGIPTYIGMTERAHDVEAKTDVRLALEAAVVALAEDRFTADLSGDMRDLSPTIVFDATGTAGVRMDRAGDDSVCLSRVSESATVWAGWVRFDGGLIMYGEFAALAPCPDAPAAAGAGFVDRW